MNVKESVENVIVMQSARQGKDTEFVSAFTDFREMDGVVKVIDPIVSNFYPVHKNWKWPTNDAVLYYKKTSNGITIEFRLSEINYRVGCLNVQL